MKLFAFAGNNSRSKTMKSILMLILFFSTLFAKAQKSNLQISVDLYDAPKKEQVTFNDLIFIESKIFTIDVIQLGQILRGEKGLALQFTKGQYKNLDIELLMKNVENDNFVAQLKLSSGTTYFETSPWTKLEFLEKSDDGTTYVFNTYDELKYWITAFITIKAN